MNCSWNLKIFKAIYFLLWTSKFEFLLKEQVSFLRSMNLFQFSLGYVLKIKKMYLDIFLRKPEFWKIRIIFFSVSLSSLTLFLFIGYFCLISDDFICLIIFNCTSDFASTLKQARNDMNFNENGANSRCPTYSAHFQFEFSVLDFWHYPSTHLHPQHDLNTSD